MFDPIPQPSTSTFELPIPTEMYRRLLELPLTNEQLHKVFDNLLQIKRLTYEVEGILLTLSLEEDTTSL